MADRPTRTVTFLFTDIQGSTRLWEDDAASMRAALAVHDTQLRAIVERHHGSVFKHTGDGMCAVFGSARDAIDAAVAAQRELDLPVRMGIATGEAEERDGDFFGPTLNRVARVMNAGHGGQILVGESTAALVDGIDLVDLGEHRLRDLGGSTRLYQVRAEGLATMFAPLRTLNATVGNLPVQLTPLVGRDLAVKELTELVRAHRLVTLSGVGGVGKTRLSLQVAAELTSDFPDGVWLVELAPVGDPAAVPDAVAAAIGVTPRAGLTVTDSIAEALAARRQLIVLDNCEHVLIAAADLVETVLGRSTGVQVLATSREGLRLSCRTRLAGAGARCAGRSGRASHRAVRATGPGGEAGVHPRRRRRGRRRHRDLPAPRRDRPGDRAGGRSHGVDERRGAARPARRPVPAAVGLGAGHGSPPDAPPSGLVVVRPARGRRAATARPLLRVRRRVRRGRRDARVQHRRAGRVRGAGPARLARAQVADHRGAALRPHPLRACWRRSGSTPSSSSTACEARTTSGGSMPPTSPPRRRPGGSSGTGRISARRSIGSTASSPTSEPASAGRRTRATSPPPPPSPPTPPCSPSCCTGSSPSAGRRSSSLPPAPPTSCRCPACGPRRASVPSPAGPTSPWATPRRPSPSRPTPATTRSSWAGARHGRPSATATPGGSTGGWRSATP